MKILGIDPASTTGWSLLEENKLQDFGSIQCPSSFSTPMRMKFYYDEIKRLIQRTNPEYCSIEDAILGISGVKTLVYLARLSAMAILACTEEVGVDNVHMYMPAEWKRRTNLAITNHSKKWEIQWMICSYCDVMDIATFQELSPVKEEFLIEINNKSSDFDNLSAEKISLDQDLGRKKRNVLEGEERKEAEERLKEVKSKLSLIKKEKKKIEDDMNKKMSEVSDKIFYQTGISSDMVKGDLYGAISHQ